MLDPRHYTRHMNQTTQIGLEPTTFAVTGRRSNQLSHWAILYYLHPQNRTLKSSLSSHLLPFSSFSRLSPRPISNSQLHTLLHFHLCPIYLVLFKGSYSCDGISHLEGGFTLRCLQRLSLPGLATLLWSWSPTGAPAARPSRSSRTKDGSPQVSCACAG